MRRRALGLTIGAGAAVFLVVLALYLPASWFAGMLPPQARCAGLGGSIWHGECLGLGFEGTPVGDATWNLSPWRALTGRLVGDLDVRGAISARADVDASFSGNGELRNVTARIALDPAVLPQVPANRRGTIDAALTRIEIADGALRSLAGTVTVHDLRQVGAHPLAFGSYQLTLDGARDADGNQVGKLRDVGGPFAVDGTVTLTPLNSFIVEGFVTGRTADAERLVRQNTVGMPDASGRSRFGFETSL